MTAKINELILIEDLQKLRVKLSSPKPPLDRYWRNFLDLAASDPVGEFQALAPLAWLITGDKKYEKNIRSVFLDLLKALPLADASVEAQFHPYTMGAPVARFAVFLDWIWDSPVLSDKEKQQLACRMVDQVYSHCFLTLKGRLPSGDNQQASMAFACAVTGYVFGIKRGRSPAAQEMFRCGVNRFYCLLRNLGAGGWCGEGSTYHCQVFAPILSLFTAFMEQMIGRDLFYLRPGNSCVYETLKIAVDIINIAGMLPGWDDYGNCAPELKTHLVYLARKSGDTAPLSAIVRHGMWSENEILGWYNDDKVWTLVFWPDDQPEITVEQEERSWLNPAVCGKLVSGNGTIDLLQMWDIINAGRPGRSHINPNSIEICSFGAVHTSDGHGIKADPDYFNTPADVMFDENDFASFENSVRFWMTQAGENPDELSPDELRRRTREFANSTALDCAHSQLAAHSVIAVDNQGHKFLREEFTGKGSDLVHLPSLKAVRGDVSAFYRSLWGIKSMKRSSLLIGERLVLVHDRFESDTPHQYTWQLMLRPRVTVAGNHARQRLREGAILDIAAPDKETFSITEIKDFPRVFEQRTHRLSIEKKCDGNGSFSVVMRPEPGRSVVKDISKSWAVTGGGEPIPAELFELPMNADLSSEYIGKPLKQNTVWFGHELCLSEKEVARSERLSIKRHQVDKLEVFVNGTKARETFNHPSIETGCREVHKCDGRFWESHFDITGLLKAGENRIAIASSEFRAQVICGPIQLLHIDPPCEKRLDIHDENQYLKIIDNNTTWIIVPNNETGRELSLPSGITTNAVRVTSSGKTLAQADVTTCKTHDFTVKSSAPIHIELSNDKLYVDLTNNKNVAIEITTKDGTFIIISNAVVNCKGKLPWKLFLNTGKPRAIFYDGACVPRVSSGATFEQIDITGEILNEVTPLCTFDQGFVFDTASGQDEKESLLLSLDSTEWRRQAAAVQVIGRKVHTWAVPRLIALYEQENQKDIYQELKANWPFSKMKTTFYGWADPDYPEDARRRFRLKVVILEALGLLGAKEAERPVIGTLENNTDFYPVLVQACIAAARLELKGALHVLDAYAVFPEINTQRASILAAKRIRGEISALEFEQIISHFPIAL